MQARKSSPEIARQVGNRRVINTLLRERSIMMNALRRVWSDEEGQDLVEYALLVFLISVAAITILKTLGTDVSKVFSTASSAMTAG